MLASGSGNIAITLTPESASRAGIETARPTAGQLDAAIKVPGIVEPNAYNQVVVRSVAAGQVRSVAVDLGTDVRRGDLLATIDTPDLAETLRVYLSMQSEYQAAHHGRLTRLEGLVKIGAASQQELETARAEHTRHETDVESARARLTLLGVTPDQLASVTEGSPVDSTVRITAPRDGVIMSARSMPEPTSTPPPVCSPSLIFFRLGDRERHECDLAPVRVGTAAAVTSASAGARRWSGRVSYVDPQLALDTRTARVRIDVANPGRALRLGMYVDVSLSVATGTTALRVPVTAVQTIGSQQVVYVADVRQAGRYFERPVVLGTSSGQQVEILSGISDLDEVVVQGSFTLRAERIGSACRPRPRLCQVAEKGNMNRLPPGCSCCDFENAADHQFNAKKVAKELAQYRRKGPGPTTHRLREAFWHPESGRALCSTSVAASASSVSSCWTRVFSSAVVVEASSRPRRSVGEGIRRGRSTSIEFIRGDFVDVAGRLAPSTAVTLDRVVCCYPLYERLLEHAIRLQNRRSRFRTRETGGWYGSGCGSTTPCADGAAIRFERMSIRQLK